MSQYSRSVLWLGKGLLGESRYKICIMTEAASWLGAGLAMQGALGAQQAQAWALGRAGHAAAGARGVHGERGRALQAAGRAGVRSKRARKALGARAC